MHWTVSVNKTFFSVWVIKLIDSFYLFIIGNVTEAEILIETPGTDLTVKDGNEQVAMHYASKFSEYQ